MTKTSEGAWLEISCHPKVREQLAAWGKPLGMSADGYAKLLLLNAMIPLVASQTVPVDAEPAEIVPRFTESAKVEEAADEADLSLDLWRAKLAEFADCMDKCPAPSGVVQGTRLYAVDDFTWTDGYPTWSVYQVDPEGGDGVSRPPDD